MISIGTLSLRVTLVPFFLYVVLRGVVLSRSKKTPPTFIISMGKPNHPVRGKNVSSKFWFIMIEDHDDGHERTTFCHDTN